MWIQKQSITGLFNKEKTKRALSKEEKNKANRTEKKEMKKAGVLCKWSSLVVFSP